MATVTMQRERLRLRIAAGWLPLAALLALAWAGFADGPRWLLMWALALAIYAGVKWRTLVDCPAVATAPLARRLGYLLLWPGMDADRFFAPHGDGAPGCKSTICASHSEILATAVCLVLGLALLALAVANVALWPATVAGVFGVVGIVLTLHFGVFHALSIRWRRAGVDAPPIMRAPLLATSLGDFWSGRWNLAFRDLAHRYVFRPLVGALGAGGATMAVFAVSGVVHELVLSLPAEGGWGGPTLYFLIQGVGCLAERQRSWRRVTRRWPPIGWATTALLVLAPLPLLLHQPFMERVMAPMLADLSHLELPVELPLATLIAIGGVLHLGILLASALVPKVLDWKVSLQSLDPLSRHLIWVHGAFIVLVIVGFGTLSLLLSGQLAGGTPLARALCGFIALFWGARLVVQLVVFDARPYLTSRLLKLGYHGLTCVFAYLAIVYAAVALH